jgi:hypothetical protein
MHICGAAYILKVATLELQGSNYNILRSRVTVDASICDGVYFRCNVLSKDIISEMQTSVWSV